MMNVRIEKIIYDELSARIGTRSISQDMRNAEPAYLMILGIHEEEAQ